MSQSTKEWLCKQCETKNGSRKGRLEPKPNDVCEGYHGKNPCNGRYEAFGKRMPVSSSFQFDSSAGKAPSRTSDPHSTATSRQSSTHSDTSTTYAATNPANLTTSEQTTQLKYGAGPRVPPLNFKTGANLPSMWSNVVDRRDPAKRGLKK